MCGLSRRDGQRRWLGRYDVRPAASESDRQGAHEQADGWRDLLSDYPGAQAYAILQDQIDGRTAVAAGAVGQIVCKWSAASANSGAECGGSSRHENINCAARPLNPSSLFDGLECGGNFLYVRDYGDVIVFGPGDFALLVDDHDSAAGDALVTEIDAVLFAHGTFWMEVGEQGILDAHFVGIGFVGPDAIHADAQYFRVQGLEIFHVVHKAGMLVGAGGTPIERIKHENDFFLSRKVGEFYFLLVLIF